MSTDASAPVGATISVAAILAESAKRRPDHPALLFEGSQLSYRELWDQTRSIAGALESLGVRPGSSVAMMIPNTPNFVRVYYAILAVGAVVVPVHPLLRAGEIEHVLGTSAASLFIVDASSPRDAHEAAAAIGCPLLVSGASDADGLDSLAANARPVDSYRPMNPLDPATVLFTSGTSGKAKGAVLSHFNLIEQTHIALIDTFDVRQSDVLAAALPLSHVFGQSNVLNTGFRRGATVVLIQRFNAADTLAELTDTGCTVFAGVPTMYLSLLKEAGAGAQVPRLRYAISGGSSLPGTVIEDFSRVFGCAIHEGYGLSETSPTLTLNHVGDPPHVGSVGKPLWGVEVRIAAPSCDALVFCDENAVGEVVVRGHGLFLGYLHDPQATDRAFSNGWFRTGDLGRIDALGRLTIIDRTKDLIIRGGYNVYPRELEEALTRMPGVHAVAVFGVPHDLLGQEVVAAVVGQDDLTADAVLAYAQAHIARHKYPRHIVMVEELPLGPSGKILKRVLASEWLSDR
ncbi:AMP-binding protein [Microbacterium esteraromaticum]|uniref:AMP-binding protein n=1 Tax=Microbacterium esteraromaticum TaxID=57043 RepID=UPI001C938155|nr:AMP-binding protein [Microbacterium esteraromaticum]MBY6060981.1 AMP-binding protein [Microbacterium esteraromaticum]